MFTYKETDSPSRLDEQRERPGNRHACGGTEVVITRDGQVLACLVPAQQAITDRVPGSAKGLFVVPDDVDAPLEDFSEYTLKRIGVN